jgi:hypothetical protein
MRPRTCHSGAVEGRLRLVAGTHLSITAVGVPCNRICDVAATLTSVSQQVILSESGAGICGPGLLTTKFVF